LLADDGMSYCAWRSAMPHYHDHEWGRPVIDDIKLFEKICLEGFQAGLSWNTILRKREAFRVAFDGFDFRRVASYDDADVARLLGDTGIVRNRAKIVSTINNARRACELVDECGSLAAWLWQFEAPACVRPQRVTLDYLQSNTSSSESIRLSRALKQRGWSFVGPTTMYALMQATGMVNDHLSGCCCRALVEQQRQQIRASLAALSG
jgi:DNA-3-methyladenine glycosylase I